MSNKCDDDVFNNGVSLGLYDMPREQAEALCITETERTGRKHDWHYIAGRVHIKAMPSSCKTMGPTCSGCPDCGPVMGDATYREMFGGAQ
ncbi:hypothetical protein ACR2VJ_27685 [Klebsiella pneumoniae]